MVTAAKYTKTGDISAVIDGLTWTIPDNISNRFRQMIANWESQGHTISAYVPQPGD